jgi:hypothetical protein
MKAAGPASPTAPPPPPRPARAPSTSSRASAAPAPGEASDAIVVQFGIDSGGGFQNATLKMAA